MKPRLFFGRLLLPAAAFISFNGSAQAADGTWNGSASNDWQTNANWSATPFPGANTDVYSTTQAATFGTTGSGTINLGNLINIRNMMFGVGAGDANGFIIGDANDTLNLSNAATPGTSGLTLVGTGVTNTQQIGVAGTTIKLSSTISSLYWFTNNSTTAAAKLNIAGNITTAAASGTSVLTLNGTNGGTVSGVISNGATATMALTKGGLGTWVLTGASNYTGATAVNGGTLMLDFSAGGTPASNIVSASSALQLGGGTLQVVGAAGGSSQTFASTTFNAGGSVISAAPVPGANLPTVALGALTFQQGATVRFDGAATVGAANVAVAATANITTTSAGAGSLGLIRGNLYTGTNPSAAAYATVGLYDWASTSLTSGAAGTSPYTIIGGSQVTGFYKTTYSAGGNFDMQVSTTAGASAFNDTVRFNTPTATTFTGNGNTVIGGFLITPNMGAVNAILAGAGWQVIRNTGGSTDIQEGVIWQNNTLGYFNVNTVLSDGRDANDINRFVKSGDGTAVFSIGSGYRGGTYINGGNVVITANSSLGAVATAAAVNLNGGTFFGNATFTLDNSGANQRPVVLLGNGGGLAASASNAMTVNGVISGAMGTGALVIGIPASAANGNVAGLLPGSGSIAGGQAVDTANTTAVFGTGIVILTGPNSYTGGTIVSSGTLNINGINALGGGNYGGLTLNGGKLQYATAFSGNGSGDLTSAGTATVNVGSLGGTIDTNGNSFSYANAIRSIGSGALTFSDSAVNKGILTLSGASSLTGAVNVSAGTLSVSGTLNAAGGITINGGTLAPGASSALGNSELTISSGGTLSNGAFNLGVGAITTSGSANILLTGVTSPINSSGAVNISGSNLLTVSGSAASAGNTYTLLSGTTLTAAGISLTGTAVGGATVTLGSSSTVGRTTYAFNATSTALQLSVTGGAFNLTWNGGNANWNTTGANWQKDGVGSNIVFFIGDNITISTGDSIAVDAGGITAGTLLVNNASGTATLTGGALGMSSFTKSGAGNLVANNAISSTTGINVQAGSAALNVANTISGAVTVSGGTLTLGASNAAGTGAATLMVSGGELALGASNQSLTNVSLTGGSIAGTSGVLTGLGSAFDMRSGSVSTILGGSVGLTKTTAATVTLSGANTYTGATAVNDGTLSLTGSLTGSNITTSGAGIFSQSSAGSIGGTGTTFTQGSSGTSVLAGVNTYTGATAVKNGSLVLDGGSNRLLSTASVVIGDTGTTGKLVLGGTTGADQTLTGLTTTGLGGSVVGGNSSNSTLTLNIAGTNTFGGTLGGAGTNENNLALVKSGVGTLTLSVSNNYAGGTQLNGGSLALGSSTAAGTGTITAANGTTIAALSGVGGNAVGNAITLSGTNANVTLTNNNASGGINSLITGTADQTLTISNAGGTGVNMNLQNSKQLQNFYGTVSIASGQSLTFRSTNLDQGSDNALFEVNGGLGTRNNGNVALGALSGSGTVSMGGSGGNNQWVTYTIGARGTNTIFSGVIQDADTALGKRVAVIKTGSATQTFSGNNTYTGTTTVSGGTLAIDGSTSTGNVTVSNAGSRLQGTGTVGGNTTINSAAIHSAGNSVGKQTFSQGLTYADGSIFEWELGATLKDSNTSGVRSTDWDAVNVAGTLTGLDGADAGSTFDAVFKVVLNGSQTFADNFWNADREWADIFKTSDGGTAVNFASIFSGFSYANTNGVLTNPTGVEGAFTINGSNLTWTAFSAVPEPSSALAGLLVAAGLLRRRRA